MLQTREQTGYKKVQLVVADDNIKNIRIGKATPAPGAMRAWLRWAFKRAEAR